MSLRPGIPWRVALQQRPPALPRPPPECTYTVVNASLLQRTATRPLFLGLTKRSHSKGTAPSANGTIVVPTGPLSFGGTPIGRTREITITVHNAGSADLTVNSVAADDPQFTLASPEAPFVVAPDERLPLRLHFTPTVLGVVNATFSLESSDPSTPTAAVSVTGRGEDVAAVIFSDSFDRPDSTVPCDLGL